MSGGGRIRPAVPRAAGAAPAAPGPPAGASPPQQAALFPLPAGKRSPPRVLLTPTAVAAPSRCPGQLCLPGHAGSSAGCLSPGLGGGHGAAPGVVSMGDPPSPAPAHAPADVRLARRGRRWQGFGSHISPSQFLPGLPVRRHRDGAMNCAGDVQLGPWGRGCHQAKSSQPLIGAQGRCWGCFGAELWRFGWGRYRGCAESRSAASVQGVRGALHLTGVQCQPGWWLQEWGAWHRTGGLVLLVG